MEDPNRAPRRAMAEEHRARVGGHLGGLLLGIAAMIVAIAFCVLVGWLVLAHQDSKLYEADGVVCASQPFAMQCWKR